MMKRLLAVAMTVFMVFGFGGAGCKKQEPVKKPAQKKTNPKQTPKKKTTTKQKETNKKTQPQKKQQDADVPVM